MTTLPLLFSVALKGLLVLALAATATHALRKAPASARHGVWAAAFGVLLLLPVLEAVGPTWTVSVLPAAAPPVLAVAPPPGSPAPPAPPAPPAFPAPLTEAEAEALAAEIEAEMAEFEAEMAGFAAEMDGLEAVAPLPPLPVAPAWSVGWTSPLAWLLGIWAVGAVVVAMGWLSAFASAHRLVRTARPETDDEWAVLAERARRLSGLAERVRLLRSHQIEVPIAWGFGRPAVVLPASADAWSDDRREAVLLHEMAHLRRRDAWTQVLAQAALSLHWPNPFAWMGYRQFLDAREQACDDAVIQGGARPSAYAEHLVGVARSLRKDRLALAAVAPMARRVPLESRIRSILEVGRRRGALGRPALGGTVGVALLVLVPLAALRPVAGAQVAPVPEVDVHVDEVDTVEHADVDVDIDPAELGASIEAEVAAEIEAAAAEVEAALAEVNGARAEIEHLDLPDVAAALAEVERAEVELAAHRAVIDTWRRRGPGLSETEWDRLLEEVDHSVSGAEVCAEEVLDAIKRSGLDAEAREALRQTIAEAQSGVDEARLSLLGSDAQAQAALSISSVAVRATEREAQRAAAEARRLAVYRLVHPPAPPAPQAAPAPPRPAPRPAAWPGRASSFDWGAVERARDAALRHDRS